MYLHNRVFEQQIWEFFKEDIESAFEAAKRAKQKDGKGGQNFMAALVILTVLDFCAGFYFNKVQPSRSDIGKFIAKYMGEYYSPFTNTIFSEQFYAVFRHGLVHEWSPKFSGIAMDFNNHEIFLIDGEHPVLNVPPFFKVVCKALADYEEDLNSNEVLRKNFDARYKEILSLDKTEADELINTFESL